MRKRNFAAHRGPGAALRRRRWLLPVACLALTLLAALAFSAVRLVRDTLDRDAGRLATHSLTPADFALVNAHLDPDDPMTVVSDNEDPQMLYGPLEGQRIDSLRITVSYDRYPYERCLYYTSAPGELFSEDKRVWPVQAADGSDSFTLPGGVYAIRLDAGSCTDLHAAFADITLNPARTTMSYFVPDGGAVFWLLVGPLLAAAALQWLLDATDPLQKPVYKINKRRATPAGRDNRL